MEMFSGLDNIETRFKVLEGILLGVLLIVVMVIAFANGAGLDGGHEGMDNDNQHGE